MLAWLPIIGPIFQSVAGAFTSYQQAKRDIRLDEIKDANERAARQQDLILAFKDDPVTKICRDLICFPVATWCALGTWDTIVAESSFSDWMFHVAKFPPGPLEYLPFAVLTFLLGMNWINKRP